MPLRQEISATIHAEAHRAREHMHQYAEALKHPKDAMKEHNHEHDHDSVPAYCYDISFRFIGASGLPQMDVGGLSDPYFVANLDGKAHYTSSVQTHTLTPVWNEQWHLKNVPSTATLEVKVYDKDDGAVRDDYIGSFKTSLLEGPKEFRIDSSGGHQMGTMWLEVKMAPTHTPETAQYTFDGPTSFSRHYSSTIGLFAGSRDDGPSSDNKNEESKKEKKEDDKKDNERREEFMAAIGEHHGKPQSPHPPPATESEAVPAQERMRRHAYSTWKVHLKGVPIFFGDAHQHWLTDYPKAKQIFEGPMVVRAGIRSAHRILYARTTMNEFGLIQDADDFWRELAPQERREALASEGAGYASNPTKHVPGKPAWLVKPAMYTYIIGDDDMFRFSETGAAFFKDFASKHALHSGVATDVRYSGEFHPRPIVDGGWAGLGGKLPPEDVEWELWIDNASGTYGPDKALLPALQKTLEYNFPGIKVRAFHFKDEELAKSKKDILDYAQNKPNLTRTSSQARNDAPTQETYHEGEAATDMPADEQAPLPDAPATRGSEEGQEGEQHDTQRHEETGPTPGPSDSHSSEDESPPDLPPKYEDVRPDGNVDHHDADAQDVPPTPPPKDA
ncbi:hypothetical protein EXIGLDRAFT_765829 [Exidia glandulosa HHB12029]|uniref:C2 domain-containing protein n=1 Tax=Exidia glandulosa HHB12029 TaxID=1314781 RepID=A0A165K6T3_EXIGL|nr:hypothetical protein EXIGLDRAFT_765829 [Exidia glandulosa HHB12029]